MRHVLRWSVKTIVGHGLVKLLHSLQAEVTSSWDRDGPCELEMNGLKDADSLLRMPEPLHDGIYQFHFDIF